MVCAAWGGVRCGAWAVPPRVSAAKAGHLHTSCALERQHRTLGGRRLPWDCREQKQLPLVKTTTSRFPCQHQPLLRHSHDRPRTTRGSGEPPASRTEPGCQVSNSLLNRLRAPHPCPHPTDTSIPVSLGWSAQAQAIRLLFHGQTTRHQTPSLRRGSAQAASPLECPHPPCPAQHRLKCSRGGRHAGRERGEGQGQGRGGGRGNGGRGRGGGTGR